MTLTKAELVDVLFDELRINKATAKDLVENIFEEVRLSLEAGEPVKLSGFGNFSLRNQLGHAASLYFIQVRSLRSKSSARMEEIS